MFLSTPGHHMAVDGTHPPIHTLLTTLAGTEAGPCETFILRDFANLSSRLTEYSLNQPAVTWGDVRRWVKGVRDESG